MSDYAYPFKVWPPAHRFGEAGGAAPRGPEVRAVYARLANPRVLTY
jgi:hypothetical protein